MITKLIIWLFALNTKTTQIVQQVKEKSVEPIAIEEQISYLNQYETRLTSYYSNDSCNSSDTTGSGLKTSDFQVNENGWYTYQGKLVIATATPYLLNYGFELGNNVHTYRYFEEITLNIDGVDYQAIVLDSCGSCMYNGRIDLFVSNRESVKDTQILVRG